jgi:dCTP deaminase
MFLSDVDIYKEVESGKIVIKEFDRERLQPASYDVLLGNKFIITESHLTSVIDPGKKIFPKTREIVVPDDDTFVLHPGATVLGTTWDYVGSREYLIQLSGKSSLARIGLIVHNTAGIVNPGHFLNITLELCNLNNVPIILRPKMEIAQLLFSRLSSTTEQDYGQIGNYNGNNWDHFHSSETKNK